ncbi:MAG: TIGR03790 family protein [Methylotenera sp.]|uniref:TIGR03790 family protein n=1 Tax=Methylotenera sp. TaxID=2051956 RepID=UPI00248949BC|nr:TIGR03790 family protein [Methylotenera sp.]MDI1308318.1 TIGR03790 family protein [Methylotenera sp.]
MKKLITLLSLAMVLFSNALFVNKAFADSLLRANNVAVVVNTANTNSVAIGQYYIKARGIPSSNLIQVNIPGNPKKLTVEQFNQLKQSIDEKLKPEMQVILLVWTAPYAVECNAITSALTLGFDAQQCKKTCDPGKMSPYFDSVTTQPIDAGLKLSMLMPTESVDEAKALIDRGVLSGFVMNEASAYYLKTSDKQRSSRARFFPKSMHIPERKLQIQTLQLDAIENMKDIMVYETGLAHVPKLDTLTFMPGALADHLTSVGGDLLGTNQMSSLKWLQAGATASFGTVSEPCNYWQKFPNPSVLLGHYLSGETAVEAYWKSVAWPAQGLFIGEPLASPYCSTCRILQYVQ